MRTSISYYEYKHKGNKDAVQIQGIFHLSAKGLICIYCMDNGSVSHKGFDLRFMMVFKNRTWTQMKCCLKASINLY